MCSAGIIFLYMKVFEFNLLKVDFFLITLQSLTGKYRGLQGNTCSENRDPVMKTGTLQ